jgi:hypothetical protein
LEVVLNDLRCEDEKRENLLCCRFLFVGDSYEIVLQDENLFQIMAYDRTANTPPKAAFTEPKRIIGGSYTKIEFNCGLYIDPPTGDIYSISNDTVDTMVRQRPARPGTVYAAPDVRHCGE